MDGFANEKKKKNYRRSGGVQALVTGQKKKTKAGGGMAGLREKKKKAWGGPLTQQSYVMNHKERGQSQIGTLEMNYKGKGEDMGRNQRELISESRLVCWGAAGNGGGGVGHERNKSALVRQTWETPVCSRTASLK